MTETSTSLLMPFWSSMSSGRGTGALGSRRCSLRGWVQLPVGVSGSTGRGAWSFMTWFRVEVLGRREERVYSAYWPCWAGIGVAVVGGRAVDDEEVVGAF